MRLIGQIIIACMFLLSTGLMAKTPLTGKQIENFVASMQEIEKWSEKNEHRFKDKLKDEDSDSPFDMTVEKVIKDMKEAGAYGEIEDIVEKYGFDTPEAWADTMVRVSKAMMAAAMEGMGEYKAQMNAQMKQMMSDPNLPAETKKMLEQTMQQSMAMANQASNADPADVAAVKPYMEKLKTQMMDMGEDEQ